MFCMNVIPSRPSMFAIIIAASTTSSSPKLLTMLPLKEVVHHSVVLGTASNSYGSWDRAGVCPSCKSLICSWLWLRLRPCSRCQNNRHVGISWFLRVMFQVGAERVLPKHCFSLQDTCNAHSTNTYGQTGYKCLKFAFFKTYLDTHGDENESHVFCNTPSTPSFRKHLRFIIYTQLSKLKPLF